MPEITPIFAQLGSNGVNSTISATDFKYLQLFVCVMKLVMQCSLKEQALSTSLQQKAHSCKRQRERALLQSIFWHCAIDLCSPKPPAQNFGWKKVNGKWKPHWSDLPVVIDSLRKLISCGCKKRCTGNCKCIQFVGLDCTPSCACYHKGCNKKGDI